MAKKSPETKLNETLSTELLTQSMMLVLEREEESAWVFPSLPRLLPSSKYHCTIVHAMADIAREGWLRADPETYWEAISKRHNQINKNRNRYHQIVKELGYNVVKDEITDVSPEGEDQILQELEDGFYQLLVIGCRLTGKETKSAPKTSSFVTHLAGQFEGSILILKRPLFPDKPLRVLMAVDGTPVSDRAIKLLPDFISHTTAKVTLITVSNPIYLENPIMAPYVNIPAVDEAMEQNAQMILSVAQGSLEAQGILVEKTFSKVGDPQWEIMELIHQEDPDLVVIGSHHRSRREQWFLGSVSQRIVQSCSSNVLVAS